MPRAMRVCNTAGCVELTRTGRCERCTTEAEARRGTARERGYDTRWEHTRDHYLTRYPLCAWCGGVGEHVDHKDGLGPLGPRGHDHANLRTLCHPCHSKRTAVDQPGGWNRRS